MNRGLRPTRRDASDAKYRVERLFGSLPLPDEYFVPNKGFPDQNKDRRPSGCTAYTLSALGGLEDGVAYSYDYQLMKTLEVMRVPPDTEGADARIAFKVPCSFGLLPKSSEPATLSSKSQTWAATPSNWDVALDAEAKKNLKPAYLPIGQNPDYFDGIRNALIIGKNENRTVGMATQWSGDFRSEVLPDAPNNLYWGHMYQVVGWKQYQGEPYLLLKTWEGAIGYRLMSRTLCNKLMGTWGAYAATLQDIPTGTHEELQNQINTLQEVVLALIQNLVMFLRYG